MKVRQIQTIRNQVYQILKEDICSGVYPPGTWLQEKDLTERLNVSRSPVREALRQLCADGLAVEYPNKGVFVRECTAEDIQEILDMRILLENHAIAMLSDQQLDREELNLCLQALEDAYAAKDMRRYTEADAHMHSLLVTMCGNRLLISVYERIHALTQLFRIFSLVSQQRFQESIEEHRTIIQNVLIGRLEEAQAVNLRHLQRASDTIVQLLQERSTKADCTNNHA